MVSNRRARMTLRMSHYISNTRYVTFHTGTVFRFRPVQLRLSRSASKAQKQFLRHALAQFRFLNLEVAQTCQK